MQFQFWLFRKSSVIKTSKKIPLKVRLKVRSDIGKNLMGHTVICGQCARKVKEKSDGRDPFGQAKPKQR